MNITAALSEQLASITASGLDGKTVDKFKLLFTDYLGLLLNGYRLKSTQTLIRTLESLQDPSFQKEGPRHFHPLNQAVIYGAASHGIELDDVDNRASLHPAVAIFSAALAGAQLVKTSGATFMEAVVAGYEAMIRIGRALQPSEHYKRGFHPTATCGTFGAAVTMAKLLQLPADGILMALGVAGSQAAGSHEYHADGAWTKRFHPGWAAHAGIMAAFMAKEGFEAPKDILGGKDGTLKAYSGNPIPEEITKPHDELLINDISMKPHACCRYIQSAIDGVLQLVKENNISWEDIKSVDVGLLGTAVPIIAEPRHVRYNPKSVVDAQFSLPFGVAVAAIYVQAGLEQYQESVIMNENVRRLMDKVTYHHDPELDKVYPRQWPSTVTIELEDGRKVDCHVQTPKGDPDNPLTREEVVAKFTALTSDILPEEKREELLNKVITIETLQDVREIVTLVHEYMISPH